MFNVERLNFRGEGLPSVQGASVVSQRLGATRKKRTAVLNLGAAFLSLTSRSQAFVDFSSAKAHAAIGCCTFQSLPTRFKAHIPTDSPTGGGECPRLAVISI
ncbi:hypothetical protein C8Q74DRAFT_116846 [Fomes fomentarius]|nr:hypothetical protein C8Q74DRAFT_116846 [Fomes fomentarius]